MELSNKAVPQVQAATARGLQGGALIAMVLPGVAAGGAVASHALPAAGRTAGVAYQRAAGFVGGVVAKYHEQIATCQRRGGGRPAGSGARGVVCRCRHRSGGGSHREGTRVSGRAAEELEKDVGGTVAMMAAKGGGSGGTAAEKFVSSEAFEDLAQAAFGGTKGRLPLSGPRPSGVLDVEID